MHRPKTTLRLWPHGILIVGLLLGCQGTSQESAENQASLLPTSWQDFPIVLEGVTSAQIRNYTYLLDGDELGLEDLIDVATYTTAFQPCDLGPQPGADLASFNYAAATEYIDEAASKRLHALIPLPYLGRLGTPADVFACDGVATETPPAMFNHDQTVTIPLGKDEITSTFNAYWQAKATSFVDAVDAYDTHHVVWSWRGLDELRYWQDGEVELARVMRRVVNGYGGDRPLIAYTPNHYLPESSLLNTLVDRPRPALSPYNPLTVSLQPGHPVAKDALNGAVAELYPVDVQVNRNTRGELQPIFDHIVTGSYTGHVLEANGHTNRIHPYHRAHLGRETQKNLKVVYAANQEVPPDSIVFHAPDLSSTGVPHINAAEARHDFWAGLHLAKGIWLYNFAYRNINPDVWEAYAGALALIKAQMRPFFVHASRTKPAVQSDGVVQTIPGGHYLGLSNNYANSDFLAMPEFPDQEYSALNATLMTMGGQGYLIVTQSWNEPVNFEVDLPPCATDVEVVYGEGGAPSLVGSTLQDGFSGIDGRVYQISFEGC